MNVSGHKRLVGCCVSLALLAFTVAAAAAPADPAAPAARDEGPAVVGYIAVRSLDDLAEAAKDAGVEPPRMITAKGLLEVFAPFIEPSELLTDRPAGLVFIGGRGIDIQHAGSIVLPVKVGSVPIERLTDAGGKAIPGHPDTVELNTIGVRRAGTHLFIGGPPRATAELKEGVVDDAVKAPRRWPAAPSTSRRCAAACPTPSRRSSTTWRKRT